MPTQIDAPIAIGALTDWGLYGSGTLASDKVSAVRTDDGDDSVIYASSGGRQVKEAMQFPALLGITDPVTSASLTGITREYLKGGGGREYYAIWNSTTDSVNRQTTVHLAAPAYVSITYSAAAGGLAVAAVNGEHGFQFSAAGGPSNKAEFWVTRLYRTVEFTYLAGNAGEFAYMVGSLAGAVIGGGLLFREMEGLAAYLSKRGYLVHPHEYHTAWEAWRRYRRPVYGV